MAEQKNPAGETRRHIEALTAAGLSVRQIADALHISTQAVYWHLKQLESEGRVA